ncbi:MAG: mercuric reductase [Elusimicrobiota bacterium]|nr:mercuric reductase [Elusimicrobiota bacterium]
MSWRDSLVPGDEHDEALAAQVHPAGWTAPEPRERYDLVVLGAGTAGLVAAAGAAGVGASVALVERGLMGGDCLNVGCVPSKALLAAARAVADARRLGEFGARADGVAADFPAVMERLRRLRAGLAPHDGAARFASLGVSVFLGEARFTGPDAVAVAGKTLRFKKAVIATGARAAVPVLPGLGEAGYLTNETVFALTELPPRLAVLGGGPIGCELAQAFARLGSSVTLVSSTARLLPKDPPEAGALVEAALRRDGVEVLLRARPAAVSGAGADTVVTVAANGVSRAVRCDRILVAVGRRPNVEGLGLEAAGVDFDPERGVVVDDFLRTTNPRVYASGDACLEWKFTHAADAASRLVVQNALFLGRKRASSLIVPWCTFTDPEVARVGLTPEAAARSGLPHRVFDLPMTGVDRAVLDGDTEGFLQVVAGKGGRVLGATMVSRHAGESIGQLTMAVRKGLTMADLSATIQPYPVQADAIRRAGDAWNRSRLTPFTKSLLKSLLRFTA